MGYVVDGINGIDMVIDKCFLIDGGDINFWWMVDLYIVYFIIFVKIFNRGLDGYVGKFIE